MGMISLSRLKIFVVLLGAITLSPIIATGQVPGVLTTDELNLQKLFIEANREKLLGSYEKAATLYRQVLKQDPRNDAAAYELSRVYDNLEQYDEALDQINTAIRLETGNPWYYLMKGDILEKLEDYSGAIEVYEHLSETYPQENYYFFHLTDLLIKTNQPERALAVLDQLESHAGLLPEIVEYKAGILNNLGRFDETVTELERLVELYPANLAFLHELASACERAGQHEQAVAYYQKILAIDPEDSRANLAVAEQFRTEGEDAAYLRSIMPIMQNPAIELDAKIAELIPYVEKFAQEPDAGSGTVLEELISELATQYPDEAKTHALYADFLYHSGQLSDAASEYEKTLVLDKSVYQVWEQLMQLQAEIKDMDGVLRTSENALNVFPNQGGIYYMRGLAYAYKEDYNQAISELQQAILMSGRNEDLRFNVLSLMGKVYIPMGNDAKAVEAFDKALEIKPKETELQFLYSAYLANRGVDLDKAESMAKDALKAAPNNPELEHVLAKIALGKGNATEALTYMERAMDHGAGDNYLSLELYGDILFLNGEVDEAVEYWNLSLGAGNQSEILKRKIAERKIVH